MRPHLRHTAALLAIAAMTAFGAVTPVAAAPLRQLALGASNVPFADMGVLDKFANDTGRMPAIWSVWVSWGGSKVFPTSLIHQLHNRNVTPMIIWEPVDPDHQLDPAYTYRKIIDGRYDAYIRRFAKAAKAEGGTVLLRWAHEANGTWFPWSTQRFDNTPARFRMAFRHIWNIVKGPGGVGATNVKFLWSPNQPCPHCDPMQSIYPGDKYVDYAGFSSFNWSTPRPWRSMVQTLAPGMKALTKITPKRVIIAETASSHIGGDKAAWITNGYPAVYAKWPRIAAIVYFNYNGLLEAVPKRDWRLTTPDDAPLNAYKAILTDPRFQGSIH